MILDAERVAASMPEPRPSGPRAFLLAFYPDAVIPPERQVDWTALPLHARVNHGCWIVSCDCGAAATDGAPAPGMVIWLASPGAWCLRCGNRAASGRWRRIVLPCPERRAAIEAVLDLRADVGDRNWEPGELIADVIAQNREHGEPVPEGA